MEKEAVEVLAEGKDGETETGEKIEKEMKIEEKEMEKYMEKRSARVDEDEENGEEA